MNFKSRLIWAKIENQYGVDALPEASDSMMTSNLAITPYAGDTVELDLDEPVLGASESINVGPHVTLTFDVPLAASGTAGTAPYWGVLMRACAMSETINAGTDVVYQPVSTGFESATIYFNNDGVQHKMPGARGTFTLNMAKGTNPSISFSFTGIYVKPVAANQVQDKSAFRQPLPVTKGNTPAFSVHGYDAKAESFSLNINNNVFYDNFIGGEEVFSNDRNIIATMAIKAPPIGTHDFFAAVESHNGITKGPVRLVHGTKPGEIITIRGESTQLTSITESNSNNTLVYNMEAKFLKSLGDDDLMITLTL